MDVVLPKLIEANIDQFTGRAWLLPALLDWYETTVDRVFLVTGGPGSGKSMIMAWLAGDGPIPDEPEAAVQLANLRAQVKAVHFCVAASGSTDPKDLAQKMAMQLTRNVPGFGQAITATLGEQVQIAAEQYVGRVEAGGSITGIYIAELNLGNLSEELSFNRILRDPLIRLYEEGYDKPILLLVDALDEAVTYTGGTNIVQLLAKLTDLPSQVRILATTRPDPRILMLLPRAKSFDLIQGNLQDVNDIKQYVLEQLVVKSALASNQRTQLATRLSQAANGIFLYAYMVLGDLLPQLPQMPDLENYPLPDGLSGLYGEFLRREIGLDDDRWYESFKPVLGLLAVAQGEGLSQTHLNKICGKDVEPPLRKCKQFLTGELPEGPFRVFHRSFADFLLDEPDNIHRHIDPSTMHGQIADYYWRTFNTDWNECDEYGLHHLSHHLLQAGSCFHDQLFTLINIDWRRLKLDRLHTDFSFMQDVENALNAARGKGANGLPRYISLSLMAGSIATKSNDVLPEVIGAMVALGQDNRAEAYLQTISERGVRSGALLQMARCYWLRKKEEKAQSCFDRALEVAQEADGIYMNPAPLIDDLLKIKKYPEAVAVVDLFHTRMKTAWNGMLQESEYHLVHHLRDVCPEKIKEFRSSYPDTFGNLVQADGFIDLAFLPTRLVYEGHPILPPTQEQAKLFRQCLSLLDAAIQAMEEDDHTEARRQLDWVETLGRDSSWSLQDYGAAHGTASEPWWHLLVVRGMIGPERDFEKLRTDILQQIAPLGEPGWVAHYAYGAALGELAIQLALGEQRAKSEVLVADCLAYCETIGGMETSVDRCKADLSALLYGAGYVLLGDAVRDTYIMNQEKLTPLATNAQDGKCDIVLELRKLADLRMPANAVPTHHSIQDILKSRDPDIIRRGVQSGAFDAQILSLLIISVRANNDEAFATMERHHDEILTKLEQCIDLITDGEWEATRHLWRERYPGVLYCGVVLDYIATRNCDIAIRFLHRFFDKARRNGRHACWVHLIASVPTLIRLSPDMLERVWGLVEPIERWHQNTVMLD